MRFDEPDVREAYRRGAHEFYEAVKTRLKPAHARKIEKWLSDLDGWEHEDPPAAPIIR